jgi:adenine-specific DNA-methyltransferase
LAGAKQSSGSLKVVRRFAESLSDLARVAFARAFTAAVIKAYWYSLQDRHGYRLSLVSRAPALLGDELSAAAEREAEDLGNYFASLDSIEAGYSIGCIYTVALPPRYRAEYGAYYTPPSLSKRLIQISADAGADWEHGRILDASCGGAAFLVPCALKMLESSKTSRRRALEGLAQRLRGFEVDPFAAWMSQVLVEAALLPFCAAEKSRLPQLVQVCDSLNQSLEDHEKFDLVIGNPPYGRVKLDPYQRQRFCQSLYGHANLYGVFTHAALGWLKENGIISYVTPTSMLGGQYFKGLRALLADEAPPQTIEFVADREGVFEDVLQETMLAVYRRGIQHSSTTVRFLQIEKDGSATSFQAGNFRLPAVSSQPWIIPRTPEHGALVHRLGSMPTRLVDYGYSVSTGPQGSILQEFWDADVPGNLGRGRDLIRPL